MCPSMTYKLRNWSLQARTKVQVSMFLSSRRRLVHFRFGKSGAAQLITGRRMLAIIYHWNAHPSDSASSFPAHQQRNPPTASSASCLLALSCRSRQKQPRRDLLWFKQWQAAHSAELEEKMARNHLTRNKMPSRLLQVLNTDNGRRLWTKSWPSSPQPNDLWHSWPRTVFKSFEPQNCSLYFSICQELWIKKGNKISGTLSMCVCVCVHEKKTGIMVKLQFGILVLYCLALAQISNRLNMSNFIVRALFLQALSTSPVWLVFKSWGEEWLRMPLQLLHFFHLIPSSMAWHAKIELWEPIVSKWHFSSGILWQISDRQYFFCIWPNTHYSRAEIDIFGWLGLQFFFGS